MQPLAWKKKQFFVQSYKSRARDLDLEHTLCAHLNITVCKFSRNPAICPREEAIFMRSQQCPFHVTLTLSTPWMRAHMDTVVCKFGHNRAVWPREEAIFVPSQKCPYHVTFDLDLDLEHTLDARSHGDRRVQVWSQSSHLCRSRNNLRKMFTDRQTTDAAPLY